MQHAPEANFDTLIFHQRDVAKINFPSPLLIGQTLRHFLQQSLKDHKFVREQSSTQQCEQMGPGNVCST